MDLTKKYLHKYYILYKKFFIIEPLVLLFLLPVCFTFIANSNLNVEKACRVNLKYSAEICDNVMDKTLRNIECAEEEEGESAPEVNATLTEVTNVTKSFGEIVCQAEIDSQKAITFWNGIRSPIASIFPVIFTLFAGGWSDRNNIRKPLIILPVIGQLLSGVCLLISSIFFDIIPMEFSVLVEKIVPAIFGDTSLLFMGIYSYLTATTPLEHRTFRYGIFASFINIGILIGTPFSGDLYTKLGYIKLFTLSNILFILGILYAIFFIEEVQQTDEEKDNIKKNRKKNCLADFFDPTLAKELFQVITRKRYFHGRSYLIFLLVAFIIFIGPAFGEADYSYLYPRIKVTWDGETFSVFNEFTSAIQICGTFLLTGALGKFFHLTDCILGLISSITTVISRIIFAFAASTLMFYVGGFFDLFNSVRALAMRALVASFVDINEIGKVFAILGIAEAIAQAIFPPIYAAVYNQTIESFSGAFYVFGNIFYVPGGIIFAVFYFILRSRNKKIDKYEKAQEKELNRADTVNGAGRVGRNTVDGYTNEAFEVTHL